MAEISSAHCLGKEGYGATGGKHYNGHKETLGSHGYVHYFECADNE